MREIGFKALCKAIIQRWFIIVTVVFLAIAGASVYYFVMVPNEFTSKTTLYVLNQQSKENVTYSDLTGSALLINDYRELVKSNKVTNKVAEKLGLSDLEEYVIDVDAINDTRFIAISVTGPEAYMSANIASELAEVFSETVIDIMRVDNVSIIDEAQIPDKPSGPHRERYIIITAFIAFALTSLIIIIVELSNTTLKTAQDVEKQTEIPVLAQMPRINGGKRKGISI